MVLVARPIPQGSGEQRSRRYARIAWMFNGLSLLLHLSYCILPCDYVLYRVLDDLRDLMLP